MADTNDPKKKKDDVPAAIPLPETAKLSGCGTTAGIVIAIFVVLMVVVFGLLVGACWR